MTGRTRPVSRRLVNGRLAIRNIPKWSITADAICCPVTVSATVVAAPICGMSRKVAVTYAAAQTPPSQPAPHWRTYCWPPGARHLPDPTR